jgi:hypothetical protein
MKQASNRVLMVGRVSPLRAVFLLAGGGAHGVTRPTMLDGSCVRIFMVALFLFGQSLHQPVASGQTLLQHPLRHKSSTRKKGRPGARDGLTFHEDFFLNAPAARPSRR